MGAVGAVDGTDSDRRHQRASRRSEREFGRRVTSPMEVSGHLVGSAAFKAVGTGDPRPAGSIPVHLRQIAHARSVMCVASAPDRERATHITVVGRPWTYSEPVVHAVAPIAVACTPTAGTSGMAASAENPCHMVSRERRGRLGVRLTFGPTAPSQVV